MPRLKKRRYKKLSEINPAESFGRLKESLKDLRQMTEQSARLGEELSQVAAKLRKVSAPENQPFIFTNSLDDNEKLLKTVLRDCDDVVFRPFKAYGRNALIVFFAKMADITLVEKNILEVFMGKGQGKQNMLNTEDIYNSIITTATLEILTNASEALNTLMTGNVLLFIDGIADPFAIGAEKFVKRSVGHPVGEDVIRGPHDSFNETLSDNIVMIRRRTRDTNLKVKFVRIGQRSRTSVALVYVANLVKPGLLEEVKRRLGKINTDILLSTFKIEDYIVDHPWSPFPQVQSTERPDKVVASVYEGRVAIIVDNTPFALIVPSTYSSIMQTPEDYTAPASIASLIIITRHIAAFIAVYLPGLYISIVSFHPGMLPTTLAISIAELRARTPFPSFWEALLMEALLELFQEAIIRLPKKIAGAAGVVGALVIGTTVVQAGLVNPLLVVVVATTAIASYTMPNYAYSTALRFLRVPILIMASVLGLYGVILGFLAVTVYMCAMRSFGESYLGAIFDISLFADWKDMLIRMPLSSLKNRPVQYGAQEKPRGGQDD